MATIQNAVKQFTHKHLGQNGVSAVISFSDRGEQCIKVSVMNLEKHKSNFPKAFLGHRLILEEFLANK